MTSQPAALTTDRPAAPDPIVGRLRSGPRQLLRHQWRGRRAGAFGVIILATLALMALLPSLLVGPLETVISASGPSLSAPSPAHLFGTDELGRDLLNLTVHGAHISMAIGLLATVLTIGLGALVGISAGFIGGRTDRVLMRLADFFLVLPSLVLALVLAPVILDIVGPDAEVAGLRMTMIVIVLAIGVTSWASSARIIRAQTLSLKSRLFVDRARAIGAGNTHIMVRHILPNVLNLIVANAVLAFGAAILAETTLAFVGLGDPAAPSWGQTLHAAQAIGAPTLGAWWYALPPAACVVAAVLGASLVGGAMDQVLDHRTGIKR